MSVRFWLVVGVRGTNLYLGQGERYLTCLSAPQLAGWKAFTEMPWFSGCCTLQDPQAASVQTSHKINCFDFLWYENILPSSMSPTCCMRQLLKHFVCDQFWPCILLVPCSFIPIQSPLFLLVSAGVLAVCYTRSVGWWMQLMGGDLYPFDRPYLHQDLVFNNELWLLNCSVTTSFPNLKWTLFLQLQDRFVSQWCA